MPYVVIVGNGTLLDQTVASLLTAEPDLRVTGVAYRADEEFIQKIADLQPDVILVSESDEFQAESIIEILNSHPVLPSCKIIVVRPDSNTLEVSERVTASHREDLLRLIRQSVLAGQS